MMPNHFGKGYASNFSLCAVSTPMKREEEEKKKKKEGENRALSQIVRERPIGERIQVG